MSEEGCDACGHSWDAHHGRSGGEVCYGGPGAWATHCPCRKKNPRIEAEDRLAAAAWNGLMGR